MKYHERRELIQSLPLPRPAKRVLEAIMERGSSCFESQQHMAARKGCSVDAIGNGFRILARIGEEDSFDVLTVKRRGQGETNLCSIDWSELQRLHEFILSGQKLRSLESAKRGVKNPQITGSRIRKTRSLESAKRGVSVSIDEMNNEMPPKEIGVVHSSIEEDRGIALVREFYRRRPADQSNEGFAKDVQWLLDRMQIHGISVVKAAVARLPDKLGLKSDRKFLRGCGIALDELIDSENRMNQASQARDEHRLALKQQISEADQKTEAYEREKEQALGWLGEQPFEVQQSIREEASRRMAKVKYGELFRVTFLVDVIQESMK